MIHYLTKLKLEYNFSNVSDDVLPFIIGMDIPIGSMAKVRNMWNEIKRFKDDDLILTPALPRGNVYANIMIVGQNPGGRGLNEARYTTVWNDGPNSKFILNCVKEADIFKDSWFTNLMPFPTIDNKITDNQVKKTKRLFNNQVKHIKPKVFIALGKTVAYYLKDNEYDIPVIEVAHPAYVRRFLSGDAKNREEYINTLASAKVLINLV